MIKINDAEEKKMIIAYKKLCSNKTAKNLLCNSSVYCEWLSRWRDDFVVDGKCLKMWHQKFVVSANKHRQGIEPPYYYHEYNVFINDVTDWMNNNYVIKQGRRNNKRKYAEMLIDHRKSCADKVVAKLKECANLSDCKLKYKLPEKTDKKFTELVEYSLIYHEKVIFKGSFDEMIIYMRNTDGFVKDKLKKEYARMNKINYFKEKKWIMAWWFKKNGNLTESQMMYQWMNWWKDDFSNIRDQRFQDAFKWVQNIISTKTKEEIHKRRYDCAYSYCRPVAKSLQELAISKGYYIRKSSVKKKPLSVSGYAVFKNGKNKPVYGKKYDLTIKQVNEFLACK